MRSIKDCQRTGGERREEGGWVRDSMHGRIGNADVMRERMVEMEAKMA